MRELASVYLHPGDVFASATPHRISTVLGPCVSVVLWDAGRGVGGMNHVALPQAMGQNPRLTKFAGPGTRVLLDRMVALGARLAALEARLFGGAHISASANVWGDGVGRRNVDAIRAVLEGEGVFVIGEDVGGSRGRRVVFCTETGDCRVSLL